MQRPLHSTSRANLILLDPLKMFAECLAGFDLPLSLLRTAGIYIGLGVPVVGVFDPVVEGLCLLGRLPFGDRDDGEGAGVLCAVAEFAWRLCG